MSKHMNTNSTSLKKAVLQITCFIKWIENMSTFDSYNLLSEKIAHSFTTIKQVHYDELMRILMRILTIEVSSKIYKAELI